MLRHKGHFIKGQAPWNKGTKVVLLCTYCNKEYSVVQSRVGRTKYCSSVCSGKGNYNPKTSTLRERSDKWLNAVRTVNSSRLKGKTGSLALNWQGGKTKENDIVRKSQEYKDWRTSVFERDNYTCTWCGDNRGGNLQADHIKPFAHFVELRFDIDNGRTLCKECHKATDTYLEKTRYKNYVTN